MADPRPLYLGLRLRRLRRELGLTQQAMASDLGISPSYIALLERDQRPMTADLLLRLVRSYRLDIAEIANEDRDTFTRRLETVLKDPIFADIEIAPLEIADLAASFPGVTEAFLRLHGAYAREQRALAEQRGSSGAGIADPVGEARRFIASERNYFPLLDSRAEALAAEIAEAGGAADWLLKVQGVKVRKLPPDVLMNLVRRFDRHHDQLLVDDTLDGASRAYQIHLHIAYTALSAEISEIIAAENLINPTTANLVRRALAGYGAAALMMPYGRFAQVVEARRYDIEAISRHFGTSFEQTAHRLTTLNRPGQSRVPFFFLRVDQAGNVSKRLDGAGFPFAAHGGGCPLWNVHSVFLTPGQIITQWLELPDGQRFFSIARTVVAGGGRHDRPRVIRAVALACAAEQAAELVYVQQADHVPAPTPIGVTCRLCHRASCTARSAPPIGREILLDDSQRSAEPFTFGA